MKRMLFLLACLIMVAVSIPVAATPVQAAPNLSLGDMVAVINTLGIGLAVRDAPAGNIITRKYDGTSGSVIGGPQAAVLPSDGRTYTWWKVRWGDDGTEGWSAGSFPEPGGADYLQKQAKPVSTKFSVGQRVRVVNMGVYNYRVRTNPPALYMTDTFKHEGDTGTITDLFEDSATYYGVPDVAGAAAPLYKGPANDYFYHFWKIQWDDGDIGWSAEGAMDGDYLTAISDVPAVDHITISPESSTILVGCGQSYIVEAFDQYGNSLGDVTSSSSFSVGGVGWNLCGNTVYPALGTYTVTASYLGKAATAVLNSVEQPFPYIAGWAVDESADPPSWPNWPPGLANCSVYLDGIFVTSTNEDGHFIIPNLSPRVYEVRVQPPLGYYPYEDEYTVREIDAGLGWTSFWYFHIQTFSTFEFYPIGDQVSWEPFPVTIWVRDRLGNLDTSYSGEALISVDAAYNGELPPDYIWPEFCVLEPSLLYEPPDYLPIIQFADGMWVGFIGIINDFPDIPVQLFASDVPYTGEGPFGFSDSFKLDVYSPPTSPDLWISEIKPVQVVWDPDVNGDGRIDLVAGKSTMVRVSVGMTGHDQLPGDTPVEVQLAFEGACYTETRTIDQLEANNKQVDFYPNAPANLGDHAITATVDPGDSIAETDETNNNGEPIETTVRDTRNLNLLYVSIDSAWPANYGAPHPLVFQDTGTQSFLFMRATYPTSDIGVRYDYYPGVLYGNPIPSCPGWLNCGIPLCTPLVGLDQDLISLGQIAKRLGRDRAVGVVSDAYFPYHGLCYEGRCVKGVYLPNVNSASIVQGGYYTAVAHEIGHSYGLPPGRTEEYRYNYSTCSIAYDGNPARGFWVEANREIEDSICFMGTAAPKGTSERWVDPDCYGHLFTQFAKGITLARTADVARHSLLISGAVSRDGQVTLGNWYCLEGATPDAFPPSGDYSIVLLDKAGQVIEKVEFDAPFLMYVEPFGAVEVDVAPFVFTIPYPEATSGIQIWHNGEVLTDLRPGSKLLHDALDLIPDHAFINNPAQRRNALHTKIDRVETMIEGGHLRAAIRVLERDIKDKFEKWLVDDYSVESPLQLSKAEVIDLAEAIIGRLANQSR